MKRKSKKKVPKVSAVPTDKELASMKNEDFPLVKVHWADANTQRGWKLPRDVRSESQLSPVLTVGWLLKKGRGVVVVVGSWVGGKVGDVTTIPTVNVSKIEVIPYDEGKGP